MALRTILAQLCPQPDGYDGNLNGLPFGDLGYNLFLRPRSGDQIPCHTELVRARCSCLPYGNSDGVLEVDADGPVVFGLLSWIYSEVLELHRFPNLQLGPDIVRLAHSWGLRDIAVLKDRLMSSWRNQRRAGSLAEDLVRAYDTGVWGDHFNFHAVEATSSQRIEATEVVSGGWPLLLQARSSYFKAMLGGMWAESSGECGGLGTVEIHWPQVQLAKLIRFLHGHSFVESSGDLPAAVGCSSFFGVPALVADANDWIATNLKLTNASMLWEFIDQEPRLCPSDADVHLDAADAKDACLGFHIKHFAELAQDPEDGDGSWVPLHDLSYTLMQKVLATGLLPIPKDALTQIVERFVCAKCGAKHGILYDVLSRGLRPPIVLFNRELRDMLAGTVQASIHTIL